MALPPGPNLPSPLQIVGWVTRPKPYLRRARARYGDTFTMRMRPDEQFVVVSHPDAVKEVFTADPEIVRAGEANRILLPVLGKHSVLLLDGPRHLRQRRLLLPPFHGERMQRYEEIITDATEREIATWPSGEALRLAPRLQEVTLDVIMRAVFGLTDDAAIRDLRARLLRLLDWVQRPSRLILFAQAMTRPALLRAAPGFQAALASVDEALFAEIRRRRSAEDLEAREDILSLLLQARDEAGEGLGDEELRDELITLLAAGHETTATGLSWAFERLVRHPEALDRATEDARAGDGTYLDAIAKETLRIRPVIPLVARVLKAPMTIGGVDLPAGTHVTPAIYLVHHREDLYPEPDAFRPERFVGVKPGTYTWLPFGGGIRRCIGASFALFEMQTVLATILRSVELRAVRPQSERTGRRAITLVPGSGAEAIPSRAA